MLLRKIINYWKEILLFCVYGIILWICKSPDISAKFYGNDNPSLLYGAKFLENRYPDPLYTFLGYPIANLPFGVDGGNLVIFLSVIPAFISSILVFLSVKKLTDNKLAPWIGVTSLMGCYIFFSQSMIIQKYPLMAVMFMASFYCMVSGKYVWASFFSGLGMGSHYMTGFFPFVAFLFCSKEFRKYWYVAVITFLIIYFSFYLLVPNFYWEASGDTATNKLINVFWQIITAAKVNSLTEIWRMGLLVVSFGLSLIPMFLFSYKDFKKAAPFLFLFLVPLTYYITGNYEYRFVNFAPFAPFYAIMAAMGIAYIKTRYLDKIILVCSLIMILSMPFVLNINLVDSNPTSMRDLIKQLDNVEDNSIIVCVKLMDHKDGVMSDTLGGHISPLVEYYNRTNVGNKHLVPFDLIAILETDSGLRAKYSDGEVIVPDYDWKTVGTSCDYSIWHNEKIKYDYWLKSIVKANPDRSVYYYNITDVVEEKCVLVKVQ